MVDGRSAQRWLRPFQVLPGVVHLLLGQGLIVAAGLALPGAATVFRKGRHARRARMSAKHRSALARHAVVPMARPAGLLLARIGVVAHGVVWPLMGLYPVQEP